MKKEVIKPFDLEAYKNGAKIRTRTGHEARIICTDRKNPYCPIIALVKVDDVNETVLHYTLEGKVLIDTRAISDNDLVIVDEIEVPEFWSDDENNIISGFYVNGGAGISKIPKTINIKGNYNVFATKKQAKSAIAMARISQIMANDIENFGGVVTDWENDDWKYVIQRLGNDIDTTTTRYNYRFLAFHTEAQRNLFLEKYHDLVKDYLMIG